MDDRHCHADQSFLLALLRAPAAPRSLRRLARICGGYDALFSCGRRALAGAGAGPALVEYLMHPDWRGVDADRRWLAQRGNALLAATDAEFPELLRQIPDAPLALFVRGDIAALHHLQLAIIGSRTPTPDGRRHARRFAADAVVAGLAVTSGLALGIDGEAHQGALAAGGVSIAVLGNGLDSIYPHRHARLAEQLLERGALVSEFPTDYAPLPDNFPRRNRIISGLSSGVLVVEAALRSGTLITAGHALDQGREVFAVPGVPGNSRARGCHALIRQGAKLVEDIEDVLEEIGSVAAVARRKSGPHAEFVAPAKLDGSSRLLLDNIGHEPVTIDSLVETTGIPAGIAASLLSNLEIAGMIESLPGSVYVRKGD